MRRPLPGVLVAAVLLAFVFLRMLGAWTGTFTLRLSYLSISQMSPLSNAVEDCAVVCFWLEDDGICTIELCRCLLRATAAPMLFEPGWLTTLFDDLACAYLELLEPAADESPGGENGQDLLGWSTKIWSDALACPAIYETKLPWRTLEFVACCYFKIGYMSSSMNTRDCERFWLLLLFFTASWEESIMLCAAFSIRFEA